MSVRTLSGAGRSLLMVEDTRSPSILLFQHGWIGDWLTVRFWSCYSNVEFGVGSGGAQGSNWLEEMDWKRRLPMLTIPGALQLADWSLLVLRLMVALVFGASGFNHLQSPRQRAESLGMSVGFTVF